MFQFGESISRTDDKFNWLTDIFSSDILVNHLSQGYKVYYTTTPEQPEASWDSQMVDNSELTTIGDLTPHIIYTVRVQAFTSMGAGPMSTPVKVKTQPGTFDGISCSPIWILSNGLCFFSSFFRIDTGVPSQPNNFRATEIGETEVVLQWSKPTHSGENIVHYELYWNDTYANQVHHK